jgi:alpha-1,2-glucosyltransferase
MRNDPKPRSDRGFAFPDPASDRRSSATRRDANATSSDSSFDRAPHVHSSAIEIALIAVTLGVAYVVAIAASLHGAARTDELYHFAQIDLFRRGEFRVLDAYLTTIPGYHAAVAAILAAFGADSLIAARIATAMFGLGAAIAFHAIRRTTQRDGETLATAQFLVLPVLAPFFFVVYTDVFALMLVLFATLATLRERHVVAAMLLCAVVLVRQSDVVWAGFCALVAAWPLVRAQHAAPTRAAIMRVMPYLAPVILFGAFWAWNGSISLSHEQALLHPALRFRLGNVLLALPIAGALFLPIGCARIRALFAEEPTRRSSIRFARLAAAPIAALVFYFGFSADNPYNGALPDFYVHNAIVQAVSTNVLWRLTAALLAAIAVRIFLTTPLRPAAAAWLFPIGAFFLSAEWLVETRYLIVPFALWLAFREQRSRVAEFATLALWASITVWLCAGLFADRLFP